MALPPSTIDRLAYQKALSAIHPWTHYYSNTSQYREGDTITVRRWCTYHMADDCLVGSYSYPHTTCPYKADEHDIKDKETRSFEKCYRFEAKDE